MSADNVMVKSAQDIIGTRTAAKAIEEIFNVIHPAPTKTALKDIFTAEAASQFLKRVTDFSSLLSTADGYDAALKKLDGQIKKLESLRDEVKKHIIAPVVPAGMVDADTRFHINPTGRFVIGGPHGDTGLTGRKIIVDTYGGMGRHGGGAFSGKDPTKVDRSACYMARYIAKNIVAAGLANRCEVQLAYAIGVAEPVSVMANTFGTGAIDEDRLVELIRAHFPLTPLGMIEHLRLRRPIYRQTAAFGHFGRNEDGFTWEAADKAGILRKEARETVSVAQG